MFIGRKLNIYNNKGEGSDITIPKQSEEFTHELGLLSIKKKKNQSQNMNGAPGRRKTIFNRGVMKSP